MSRELFLHVGMHKTGTTSLQQTCFAGRAVLAAAGIGYLDTEPNHSFPVFGAFTEEPHRYHVMRLRGFHAPAAAEAEAAGLRAELVRFLREAAGPRLLISGEDIAMLSTAATRRLLARIRPLVDRITVVALVRPPRSYMVSSVQQRIRGGALLADVAEGNAPHYRRRFEKFLDAAEVAEVRLGLYAPDALLDGDSVATVLALCGADPGLAGRLEARRRNTGASRLATLLCLAANEALPVFQADGSANPARDRQLTRVLERVAGAPFTLPADVMERQLAAVAEDVAWMEARLGRPFPPEAARPGNTDLGLATREELQAVVLAINGLLRGGADAAPAGAPIVTHDAAGPTPAQREARRRERQAARRQGRGDAG